jgi:tRNA-2-methylthio-N6-dimethylallyladenosine synthase
MAEVPSVCEHLHFPLQSGSDSVLARMHRGYDSNRYLTQLNSARESIPDLAVTTDIIVGFPGETEADFEATLEVASAAEYDGAFTFIF